MKENLLRLGFLIILLLGTSVVLDTNLQATGESLRIETVNRGVSIDMAWNSDDTQVAFGSDVGIGIYNTHNGQLMQNLTDIGMWEEFRGDSSYYNIEWSVDDSYLANTKLGSHNIWVWDPSSGVREGVIFDNSTFYGSSQLKITDLKWHPSNNSLLYGTNAGIMKLWHSTTNTTETVYSTGNGYEWVSHVDWNADGTQIVFNIDDNVHIYDLETSKIIYTFESESPIHSLVWQNDKIVIGFYDYLGIYTSNLTQVKEFRHPTFTGRVKTAEFNAQQDLLLVNAGSNDFPLLFDVTDDYQLRGMLNHGQSVTQPVWNHDGDAIVMDISDIVVWKISDVRDNYQQYRDDLRNKILLGIFTPIVLFVLFEYRIRKVRSLNNKT